MFMTSGQWDLNALEALEREASEEFDILEHSGRHRHRHTKGYFCTKQHVHHHSHGTSATATTTTTAVPTTNDMMIDLELQDHIKHCSCTCNHMGYGNFMDYQTSCFGGLPDVTEHSNRHQILLKEPQSTTTIDSDSSLIINQKLSLSTLDISTPQNTNNNNNNNNSSDITNNNNNNANNSNRNDNKELRTNNRPPHKKYFLFVCSTIFILTLSILIGSLILHIIFHLNDDDDGDRKTQEKRMTIVKKLLHETPLIDGHNNLPWNIRRFTHNRLEYLNLSRNLEETFPWHKSPWSQTDVPRLKQGLIGAQFWSVHVPCEAQGLDAVQLALEQIDLIQRFSETYDKYMRLVASSVDVIKTHQNGMIASMIGLEGGHALGASLGVLRTMYKLGVRYLTVTHKCDNSLAASIQSAYHQRGLTSFGRIIIKEMNRIGMIIDLSYASDTTVKDVLKETRAPIIFSHSAARSLCNSTRNVDDDVLRAIADNGGIIMISFHANLLTCSRRAAISDVIKHINYIRSISGIQHIGIGAGYDGIDTPPLGLEDVSKYPNIFIELLKDTNWTENDISLLAGKNFLRVLKSVENVSNYLKNAILAPQETLHPQEKPNNICVRKPLSSASTVAPPQQPSSSSSSSSSSS